MTGYAIRIGSKYFKDYIYADKDYIGRHGGNTGLGTVVAEGDIVDVKLTNAIERTEVARSIGNTISTLYQIEKMKGKTIEIIPIEI